MADLDLREEQEIGDANEREFYEFKKEEELEEEEREKAREKDLVIEEETDKFGPVSVLECNLCPERELFESSEAAESHKKLSHRLFKLRCIKNTCGCIFRYKVSKRRHQSKYEHRKA